MVDLTVTYQTGVSYLQTWKNRYSSNEYPEKILQNIFYRKYTTEFMWTEIEKCFQKKLFGGISKQWDSFDIGFERLNTTYSNTAQAKTHSLLPNLLKNTPERVVGNLSYRSYNDRLIKAKNGSYTDIEEIEFAYLYYLLTDQAILMWATFGGLGYNKIDSISQLTNVIIKPMEIENYSTIESVIGQLFVSPFLDKKYKPLN